MAAIPRVPHRSTDRVSVTVTGSELGPGSIERVQSEAAGHKASRRTGNKATARVQGPSGDRTGNSHICDIAQAKSEGPSLGLNGTPGPGARCMDGMPRQS